MPAGWSRRTGQPSSNSSPVSEVSLLLNARSVNVQKYAQRVRQRFSPDSKNLPYPAVFGPILQFPVIFSCSPAGTNVANTPIRLRDVSCTSGKGVVMKKIWLKRFLVAAGCSAALLLTGCYTQVGTENERTDSESYATNADDSTVAGSDSTAARDYEYERRQMYFDYYYPSFVFSVGYSSPWYWGPTWWYSPYWTPYWYGYAWYAPIYYPGWYYPYYGYPYYGYPSYGYPYPGGGSYVPYATRSFGNTRTVGATRGYAGSTYSTGSMIDAGRTGYRSGGVSTGARATPGVRVPTAPRSIAPAPSTRPSTGQRSAGGQRYVPPRSGGTYNPGREYTPTGRSGSSQGSGGARVGSGTQAAPDHGTRGGAVRPGGGSYSPPPSSGGGGGGGRSGGGSSSPPPSSGGGGGGSRGGNHR
jgi:hypothetical protein